VTHIFVCGQSEALAFWKDAKDALLAPVQGPGQSTSPSTSLPPSQAAAAGIPGPRGEQAT